MEMLNKAIEDAADFKGMMDKVTDPPDPVKEATTNEVVEEAMVQAEESAKMEAVVAQAKIEKSLAQKLLERASLLVMVGGSIGQDPNRQRTTHATPKGPVNHTKPREAMTQMSDEIMAWNRRVDEEKAQKKLDKAARRNKALLGAEIVGEPDKEPDHG